MNITEQLKKEAILSQENAEKHPVEARYNRNISEYEHYLGISMNKTLRRLNRRQNHPLVVLDVMCGGGKAVQELNRDYGIDAFGVDMMNYPEHGNSEYCDRFIIAPAENLSMIPNESVDLLVSVIGIAEYSSSLYTSMSEALRVLRPGGELHATPFMSKGELNDKRHQNLCHHEGYRAIEDYEKRTGQKLKYESTRKILPLRNLVRSGISCIRNGTPMITQMFSALHLEKRG